MKKILPVLLLVLCLHAPVFAQDNNTDISISIDSDDLEEFFEELGESIEAAFSGLSEVDAHVSVTIDEERFEASMERFGEEMEKLGESIEHAVKNMEIELKNIDADDIKRGDGKINGQSIGDIIDEIEDDYNSDVETVDRMLIKFRDDEMRIEMDVTLENGKEIRNIRKRIRD